MGLQGGTWISGLYANTPCRIYLLTQEIGDNLTIEKDQIQDQTHELSTG